jgi:hypothetical protein
LSVEQNGISEEEEKVLETMTRRMAEVWFKCFIWFV